MAKGIPKRRVLHVGPLPPPIGGMAMNVQRYLQSDVTRQCDVRQVNSDLIGKTFRSGFLRTLLNLVNALILLGLFVTRLVTWRPELVHVRTNSFTGFYEKSVLAVLARLAGRRVIMHIHGGAFRDFYVGSPGWQRRLILRCLLANHRVVALSEQMRAVLLEIGLPAERIAVIENAVFLPEVTIWDRGGGRQVPTPADRPLTVIFLNRIVAEKGVLELVEAMAELGHSGKAVRCRIYGPESPICDQLRQRISAEGLTDRIELAGAVWDRQKEEAFLSADIYILASYVEGMPISLLEAMSYGLPCVVTPVGGVPSVIADEVNGLLVPVKDSQSLARAILRLTEDAALRRRLGSRARETIVARFNWEISAQKIIALYNDVLRG